MWGRRLDGKGKPKLNFGVEGGLRGRAAAAPWLMALSGAAALAFETVWMRMLSRAFGVTVHAVAGLTALYMVGLALGAGWAARVKRPADWLRIYAWLELAGGLAALGGSWWLSCLPEFAARWGGGGPPTALWRLALAAPALLPPTILLGATLPVLARDEGRPALLYGANTIGAMGGLAGATFLMIGSFGETATLLGATGLVGAAGGWAFWLSRTPRVQAPSEASSLPAPKTVLALLAVSGFCAMGCEVLWSRLVVPLMGNSTYAFALVLSVYLGGAGLGSCARPLAGEPWEKLATLFAAAGTAMLLSAAAGRFIGISLDSPAFLYSPLRAFSDFPLLAGQAFALVLPTALMMGFLFSVGIELSGGGGRAAGELYAWNTAGAIAGSLSCGFLGIKLLGAHRSLLLLSGIATAAGFIAAGKARRRGAWAAPAVLSVISMSLAAYAWGDPSLEILLGRLARRQGPGARVAFHDESPAATITGADFRGYRSLLVNGIETSGNTGEGALMALVGHVLAGRPREVLVVCFGGGNAFRAASLLGARVDAVELIGDVVRRAAFFHEDAPEHLSKPGNRVFIEDGRSFLLRSRGHYDVIIVDGNPPLHSSGTVNLYSKEFLALARSRLRRDGVLVLWLPTLSFESDYWRILAALGGSFEHLAVWRKPGLSGFIALGSGTPFSWPKGDLARRIKERGQKALWPGFDEAFLRSGFAAGEPALRAFAGRFEPLSDGRPGVEFPLPRLWRGEIPVKDTEFLLKAR